MKLPLKIVYGYQNVTVEWITTTYSTYPECPPTSTDAAVVNIAQMTFLATAMNILSIVANINNNINNNNNNNNQVNINAQSNNNIVSNTNVNNGNQVNVMVPVLNP